MSNEFDHAKFVDAWLIQATAGLPSDQLLSLFERALHALWCRACLTLGDVTLTAIVDRVLHSARQRYPLLAQLQLDTDGISRGQIQGTTRVLRRAELEQGMRFALVEFLTILGTLTAEILSPVLLAFVDDIGNLAVAINHHESLQQVVSAVQHRADLLSTVAHELRSPLSAIMMADLLRHKRQVEPEVQRQRAAAIKRSGQRMNLLVEDLLDMASISARRMQLDLRIHLVSVLIDAH